MKLDRNTNKDGRGKYALINLRTNQVQWGNEGPGEQFFVMKYKDKFTGRALLAYSEEVKKESIRLAELSIEYRKSMKKPDNMGMVTQKHVDNAARESAELKEFADQMFWEAQTAMKQGFKNPD